MVSIVVCSVDENNRAAFQENVSSTIGVEHEFFIFDNRVTGNGICQVYNVPSMSICVSFMKMFCLEIMDGGKVL